MAHLDKSRTRVLCDEYPRCGTQLAEIVLRPQGRILSLAWGWKRDADRVWCYSARRAARTPPKWISGVRHAKSVTFEPMINPIAFPQWIACPSPKCQDRAPQALDPDALDVLRVHDRTGRTEL